VFGLTVPADRSRPIPKTPTASPVRPPPAGLDRAPRSPDAGRTRHRRTSPYPRPVPTPLDRPHRAPPRPAEGLPRLASPACPLPSGSTALAGSCGPAGCAGRRSPRPPTRTQAFVRVRAPPRPAERGETAPSRDARSHPLGQPVDPSSPSPSACRIGVRRVALACNGRRSAVVCSVGQPNVGSAVRRAGPD
jgi:hypothetical protein